MKPRSKYVAAAVAAGLSVGLAALLLALPISPPSDSAFAQANKASKAQKAKTSALPQINDDVDDPAVWGKLFPLQYELYLKTVDMERTKYGGSIPIPRTPP